MLGNLTHWDHHPNLIVTKGQANSLGRQRGECALVELKAGTLLNPDLPAAPSFQKNPNETDR